MADAWLTPIITEFKTILTANLPAEIDDIDAELEDIPTQFMHKAMMQFNLQYPSIEIFPFGQSELNPHYNNCDIDFDWRIATVINLNANDAIGGANYNRRSPSSRCVRADSYICCHDLFSINFNFVGRPGEPINLFY